MGIRNPPTNRLRRRSSQVEEINNLLKVIEAENAKFYDPFSQKAYYWDKMSVKTILTIEHDIVSNQGPDRLLYHNINLPEEHLLPVYFTLAKEILPPTFDFRCSKRIFLQGEPNCGKTTLMRRMAQICAQQQLVNNNSQHVIIPLIVNVSQLDKALHSTKLYSFHGLLTYYFEQKFSNDIWRKNRFIETLSKGNFWLFLDGIDELNEENQKLFWRGLEEFCLSHQHGNARIIASIRKPAIPYIKESNLFDTFSILTFEEISVSLSETVLETHLYSDDTNMTKKIPDWLSRELVRQEYQFFRKNPLTLLLLVFLVRKIHVNEQLLPCYVDEREHMETKYDNKRKTTSRVEVLRQATFHLLEWKPTEIGNDLFHEKQFQTLDFDCPLNLDYIELAENMHQLLQFSAYQALDLQKHEINVRTLRLNCNECSNPKYASHALDQMLKSVEQHQSPMFNAPVFEQSKMKQVSFVHATMQEHLAAEYIAQELLRVYEENVGVLPDVQSPSNAFSSAESYVHMNEGSPNNRSHSTAITEDTVRNLDFTNTPTSIRTGFSSVSSPSSFFSSSPRSLSSPSSTPVSTPTSNGSNVSNLMSNKLKASMKEAVQQYLIGHYDQSQYRLALEWFQPTILKVFDMLYFHRCVSENEDLKVSSQLSIPRLRSRRSSTSSMSDEGTLDCGFSVRLDNPPMNKRKENLSKLSHNQKRKSVAFGSNLRICIPEKSPPIRMKRRKRSKQQNERNRLCAFNAVLQTLVDLCCAQVPLSDHQIPQCLERFWLSACGNGNLHVVQGLMDIIGANIVLQATNDDGNNAMHLAAMHNQPEIIKLLRKQEFVDTDYLDRNNDHGWDPSNMAMVYNNTRCFRLLCQTDGDKVAQSDERRKRPEICDAAKHGDFRTIQRIVFENRSKSRNFLQATGSTGMTAAMWAARNGYAKILQFLVDSGAKVIHPKACGISTLIFAVESGHLDCVKILIDAGADAQDRTPEEDSCLLSACSFGYDGISRVLIDAGASALEALVVSCVQGKDSTVCSLIQSSMVDVNEIWEELMVTPLAGACVAGHLTTVQLLLAMGADPNVGIDVEYGSTPLMLACHMGNPDVVQAMIDGGANVNAVTPADSQCAESNGMNTTCTTIARINRHVDIERILRQNGAHDYIPTDYQYFQWLGGIMNVEPSVAENGNEIPTDPSMWQWLGGLTEGQTAWMN